MPYQKRDKTGGRTRREYYIGVPTRNGGRVKRSAKTSSKRTARNYEAMFGALRVQERDADDFIDLVLRHELSIPELYRHYVQKRLDALRARFAPPPTAPEGSDDRDIEPFVERWRKGRRQHVAASTLANYLGAVRLLIPADKPFLRSQLNKAVLSTWMSEMEDVKPAAVHYRWSGMLSFINFLIEQSVLVENPARGIKRPKLPVPRCLYLSAVDAMRLADALPGPHRELSILLNATGAEVSAALKLRRREIDERHREISVTGTKREHRQRLVRAAEWAWPQIEKLIAEKQPGDLLFDDTVINRFNHWRAHKAAVARLVAEGHSAFTGYTPRDARHTFAVRLVRAGVPLEMVAQQLGHKDSRMVSRVYGRFVPRHDERNRWELTAAASD